MSNNATTEDSPELTLYVRDYCMYCNRVLRVIDELKLDVKIRNIWDEREHAERLAANTGRQSVPVLHIKQGDREQWMPESADIVRYLNTGRAAVNG